MSNIEETQPIDVLVSRVWSGTHWHYPHIETMIARIKDLTRERDALQATVERCRAAGFLDEKGEVRKVCGELLTLASGEILGFYAVCYAKNEVGEVITVLSPQDYQAKVCYSTQEAAERAKGGGDA